MTPKVDFTPIYNALENDNEEQLKTLIHDLNPTTVAELLGELENPDRLHTFLTLPTEERIDVMRYLDFDSQAEILEGLTAADAKNLVEKMPHDIRVDLLNRLPDSDRQEILRHLAKAEREDIRNLSKYEEGTTGSVMTSDYAVVHPHQTVEEAMKKLRLEAPDRELIYYAYVIDNERHLMGAISLRGLIVADPKAKIADILTKDVEHVKASDPDHIASRKLKELDLIALPVINENEKLVGMVTFDDAMQTLEEDVSDTMYQKAGVMTGSSTREKARDVLFSRKLTQGSILYPVRLRITFLLVTLAGGFLVGSIIDGFEDLLAAVVVTAVFIPVIMDMGGNVGTQSTTIFARGLALGHIKINQIAKHIGREMTIGVVMGIILGLLGGLIAYYWQGVPNDVPEIGLAVAISLAVIVPLATFLGFFIPFVLLKLGWDHAPGADPFITTIKDFIGLSVYFTLVNLLVGV